MIPQLSIRLNPGKTLPSINVYYTWHNAGSYNIENKMTSLLEAGFATVQGIEKISSKSSKNTGRVTLEVNKHYDLDAIRFEVSSIIKRLHKKLPEGSSYPIISINNPEDDQTPFLSYTLVAPYSPYEILQTVKNTIIPEIGSIKGVSEIKDFGAAPLEWHISYSKQALENINISKSDLIFALQRHYKKISLGEVNRHNQYLSVVLYPDSDSVNWKIPVKTINNRIIYFDDITKIKLKEQEATRYYRINGQNAIGFYISANQGTNTIALAKTIQDRIETISSKLGENYQILELYDSTNYLQSELDKIYKRTFYTLIILLVFILLVSFSIRYSIVIILSLGVNLSLAFLFYKFFDIELNLYSLAGITVSLGLMIDNIIIMSDHIRNLNNRLVFIPILASTSTTLGALSVIFFLDDNLKLNLQDFASVVIINLFVSLFIALFFVPALLEKIKLRPQKFKFTYVNKIFKNYAASIKFLYKYRYVLFLIGILAFGIPIFMLPDKIHKPKHLYEKAYNKTIGNEWYQKTVRPIADKLLGGSLRLFSQYVMERSFYRKNEETKLYVTASMEKGVNIHQMNEAFLQIENYLKLFEQIDKFVTNVYSEEYGRIEITFDKAYTNTDFPVILESKLISKVVDLGGIEWSIYGIGEGYSKPFTRPLSNYRLKCSGYNYDKLKNLADTLGFMLSKHPRVKDLKIREYDNSFFVKKSINKYVLNLNKEDLVLSGNNPFEIYQDIKEYSLLKYPQMHIMTMGLYTPLRLTSVESDFFDIWHLQNSLMGNHNHPIRLKNISTIKEEKEQENIFKENQEYLLLLEYQYVGAKSFGNTFLEKNLTSFRQKLPLGYKFETAKFNFFSPKSKKLYVYLLLLIATIIFFICTILFESFKQSLVILSIVPISFIGVFLTFYYFSLNFDQGGLASFILLSGITVNSSIYILDEFNKIYRQHQSINSHLLFLVALKRKIIPVLLTILSTIFGFVPFIMSGQNEVFWFSLAAGTIGGLVFSLIAILVYLPMLVIKKIT